MKTKMKIFSILTMLSAVIYFKFPVLPAKATDGGTKTTIIAVFIWMKPRSRNVETSSDNRLLSRFAKLVQLPFLILPAFAL